MKLLIYIFIALFVLAYLNNPDVLDDVKEVGSAISDLLSNMYDDAKDTIDDGDILDKIKDKAKDYL
jgi:hypothetical protein